MPIPEVTTLPPEVSSSDQDGNVGGGAGQEEKTDSILTRKLKKILDSDLETDTETAEALTELSTFFTDNTLRTRRFLRGDIERRSLQINKEFLEEFTSVKDAVEDVHEVVKEMNDNCLQMKKQLEETKAKTRDLIRQTNALQSEAASLARNETLINDFIEKYQLKDEEIEVLKGQVQGPEFFRSLERVQKIHSDCKDLMQQSSGQERTASEILEQMSMFQEAGLERLYRWTQSQCRNIEGAPENNTTMQAEAMKHLQERPVMFNYVVDEYCASR